MKLIKDNIILRPFVKEDISEKVRIINDEHNNKYLHYDLPLTQEGTTNWFKTLSDRKDRLDLTITKDSKVAGFIGLLSIDTKNKKAEYYVCVDYAFAGQGIATIASKLLFNHAFKTLGLNKIYLFTEKDNIPAQKLFEKLNIKQEGLLKADLIHNDKVIDRYAYGLCKEDYE